MSSDDDDLKRAIALSLAEAKKNVRYEDPIIISSDDDEPAIVYQADTTSTIATTASTAKATAETSTFLSERAQLEAARLARLQRMKETSAGTSSTSSSKRKIDPEDPFVSSDEEPKVPTKKCKLSTSKADITSATASSSKRAQTINDKGKQSEENMIWSGELRQTANMYADKAKDTRPVFRLHDILGEKSDLTFCILSSYVTQLTWIYSLLPSTVPVVLVGQPGEDGAASVHNVLPNWVKVTPHLRGGRGCMHIKFMLLFYKSGRMRVVITTANFMDYDWRDIENSVWLQDIRQRPQPLSRPMKGKPPDDFGAQFEKVLNALNVPDGLRALRIDHPEIPLTEISDLRRKWDFSQVTAKLVASLAGKHEGWPTVLNVGHVRLMRVVKDIGGFADAGDDVRGIPNRSAKGKEKIGIKKRTLQLECQTSSIGSYTPAWIDEFFISARGASPEEWLDSIKTKRAKEIEARVKHRGWPRIKILFPSLATVLSSQLGVDGAGTMFCQHKQWNGVKFPRDLFHDSNSKRGPILMHSKMILATFNDAAAPTSRSNARQNGKSIELRPAPSPSPDSSVTEFSSDEEIEEVDPERNEKLLGWMYVGSHNFTPSAWGTLSGTSFNPVMNITNYELGVVLPLTQLTQANDLACWNRPPRKYDLKTDEPWIQQN